MIVLTDPRPDAWPEWDDLIPAEQLAEIRRGDQSAYWDDFADDPTVWFDCPTHGRVVLHADGECQGHEADMAPHFSFDNRKDYAA